MNPYSPQPDEWMAEFALDINGVRLMHDLLDHFITTWPGSPARPAIEQEFACHMKQQMFAMKMEHQFSDRK